MIVYPFVHAYVRIEAAVNVTSSPQYILGQLFHGFVFGVRIGLRRVVRGELRLVPSRHFATNRTPNVGQRVQVAPFVGCVYVVNLGLC